MGAVTDGSGNVLGYRGPDNKLYRSEKEYKAQVEANRGMTGKVLYKDLRNDRGLLLGNGLRVDAGDGTAGVIVPGAKHNVKSWGTMRGTAPITLGNNKLYPMFKGKDVLYVNRGFKPGGKADPPKTDPPKTDPPKSDPPKSDPPKTAPPQSEAPVETQTASSTPPQSTARVNANGLVSYGKDLSSLNQFTSAFTGGYELTDIKSAFQSNALPTTASGEKQGHEAPRTNYSWDSESEEGVWNDETGRLELPTAPGTTGGKPVNAQDGTSSKPDVAESIRTVRMQRQSGRGSRRDPRNRGENADMFGGPEPSDESLTSPMYANAKRNKIRSTFLDHEGSSVQAIAAANAVAGYGKDSDGNARFNYGGELVYAKDGMQQKAKNAAMMGQDPTQFLDIPATPDTQPDTPAASELSPAFAQETPGAQEFFRTELKKVKDKNK